MLAKQKGKLSWTPPYMFFTQGVPGISCVMPMYRAAGQFRGLAEFRGGQIPLDDVTFVVMKFT